MVPATRSWRGWLWLLVAAVTTAVLLLRSSVWAIGPASPALSNEKGVEMTTISPWFNATVSMTTTDEPSPCGRLLLDNWAKGQNFKVVLLSIETEGAFGNELFIVAKALVAAQRLQYPVLLTRPSRKRQILQLPCLRSSLGLQRAAEEMCPGCGSEKFWDDRSKACNRGYGCLELLRKQKRVMDPGAGGFHQDLGEWKEPPLSWRPLLAEAFQVDMPQMKTEVIMPGNEDLVMYFRPYRRKQIFDLWGDHAFLTSPPFAFFDFAVQQHRRDFPSGKLLVIAEPSMRSHPTVGRLCSELGAAVVTDMDQAGKQAWLADWVWLRSAKHLVLSPSTFVWWAAFLSEALRIYVPIFPGIAALPWCKLLPSGDPRYLFYDFWTNTTFTDARDAL